MSFSRIKLHPDKTEFIILGSYFQLEKLDSYLLVRLFRNFLHVAVIGKDLGVLFDAKFTLLIISGMFANILALFKCLILGGLYSI